MTYTVRVQAPKAPAPNWHYPANYFPRKLRYLTEAKRLAQSAVDSGAPLARIEYPNGVELDFRPRVLL